MKKFHTWLVSKLIKDYQNTDNLKVRAKYGLLEGWVSVIVNFLLGMIKIIFGTMLSSIALIADGVHSFSDFGSSGVVILGFKVAGKQHDKEHPFGHGRMELIATLIISILLFVIAIEFIKESGSGFIEIIRGNEGELSNPSWLVIGIIASTTLVKFWLSIFSIHLGKMIESGTLHADAWHHLSDAISTIFVIASLIGMKYGVAWIDSVGGILVSLVIIWAGYTLAKDAVNPLLGQAPSSEIVRKIKSTAQRISGVMGVHDIIVHNYGNTNIISLHIELDKNFSATQVHDISEAVENIISDEMKAQTVVVHPDPISTDNPKYIEVRDAVNKIVEESDDFIEFHDLRIISSHFSDKVLFDLVVKHSVDENQYNNINYSVVKSLKQEFPDISFNINVETSYSQDEEII